MGSGQNQSERLHRDGRTDSAGADDAESAAEVGSQLEQDSGGVHDAYAALRVPGYRRFVGGWVFASMGLQMQGMALGWEIYERTQSAFHLGLVGLFRALPVIVLALPAGQIVDTLNRKRVLIATQFLFALVSAGIALASYHNAPLAWMYALVVLSGCARVFNGPCRSSLLPQLIPVGRDGKTDPEIFHNAVTWNSGVFHLSAVAGPLIAGQIIASVQSASAGPDGEVGASPAWPVFAMTTLGCIIFGFAACFIHPRPNARSEDGLSLRAINRGMLDGARHVWREKTILGAITLDLFAVLLGGATALLPIYAKDILHVGPVGLGALKAAPYVGAVAMSLYMAHRPPLERPGRAMLWSVAGFGLCMIVFGLSQSFVLSLCVLFLSGLLDNISVVIRHVLVQMRTPEQLRGRVSAVNSVFIESSNELGAFESGLAAELFTRILGTAVLGAVGSVVSGGIGTVAVVAAIAVWLPEVRRLGRLREVPPPRDDDQPRGKAGSGGAASREPALAETPATTSGS